MVLISLAYWLPTGKRQSSCISYILLHNDLPNTKWLKTILSYYPTRLLWVRDTGLSWGWLLPAPQGPGPWLQNWKTGAGLINRGSFPHLSGSWCWLLLKDCQPGHAHNTLAAFPGQITPADSQAEAMSLMTIEVTQGHFHFIL